MSGLNGVGGILDDLIVTGSNDEEHFRNLESTLKRLHSMGVKLKQSKCMFMKPPVEYFAFVVDRHRIHPSPCKVQAIQEVPVPENPTKLKSFLGLVNYYRKFIPDVNSCQPVESFVSTRCTLGLDAGLPGSLPEVKGSPAEFAIVGAL